VASTPSLKMSKTFTYRGVVRTWSNRYHFSGGTPSDSSHWTTFANSVMTAERLALSGVNTIVRADGYAAGSDVPVFTKTYTATGSVVTSGMPQLPGDVAAIVRYATTARTSKNHPVYLYNYYHGVFSVAVNAPDSLFGDLVSGLQTYANAWVAGFSDGTNTYKRAGPNGATATGQFVNPLVTHRDLPR
jgi:hypothetical protein